MSFNGTTIDCPLCAATPDSQREVAERGRDGSALRTVLCTECAMVFTNPMPTLDEVTAFYSRRYRTEYKHTYQPRPKHVLRSARRALPRLDRLRALGRTGGRLLDVGSGGGEFLYLMRRAGFDARGIEPNQGYGEFSRETYGLDVEVGTLESADRAPGSFDIITAHHVLEHMRDPVAALTRLAGWLDDSGVLVIEVPNVEATYHAPASRYHFAHVLHFSPATLAATGARAGLEAIDVITTPGVRHVNIAFRKAAGQAAPEDVRDREAANRVHRALVAHTALRHLLSPHPYVRLAQNLARPVQERLALGSLQGPQSVMDRVYAAIEKRG